MDSIMKIAICTTPIRPIPTTYPPFGSLAIIQSLRKIGQTADFFDIDFHRYTDEQIENYFKQGNFAVVGISAVVSTAYSNTKLISRIIKKVSPRTIIVCGGNLAASSEILLRKTDVDICVVGDGEITFRELISIAEDSPDFSSTWRSKGLFSEVSGLAFLDTDNEFVFTGFRRAPDAEEIETPDFTILEESGSLGYFIYDVLANGLCKETTVISAKGCVARCTFCHRWERGYRVRPIDRIIEHINHLYEKYGVRSINFGDENFGSDKEFSHELAGFLGDRGISWEVAGVRARTVSIDELVYWKSNGCRRAIYGVESGSESILKIMQKGITRQQNYDAMKWVHEAGMTTTLQYVIGMPGENDSTINESIDFAVQTSRYFCYPNSLPSLNLSINYAQALPGTPLYEYARENGFLGSTLDSEEQYLIRISNLDAYSSDHFINYTGFPLLKVLMWRYKMIGSIDAHFIQSELGISLSKLEIARSLWVALVSSALFASGKLESSPKSPLMTKLSAHLNDVIEHSPGYFNISKGAQFSLLYFDGVKRFSYPLLAIFVSWNHSKSVSGSFKLLLTHIYWSMTRKFRQKYSVPARSLRKSIDVSLTSEQLEGSMEMVPIRMGR
jgi:anaerobic magnesium-protoporphyrin IX monomethyl ester cyclase